MVRKKKLKQKWKEKKKQTVHDAKALLGYIFATAFHDKDIAEVVSLTDEPIFNITQGEVLKTQKNRESRRFFVKIGRENVEINR